MEVGELFEKLVKRTEPFTEQGKFCLLILI